MNTMGKPSRTTHQVANGHVDGDDRPLDRRGKANRALGADEIGLRAGLGKRRLLGLHLRIVLEEGERVAAVEAGACMAALSHPGVGAGGFDAARREFVHVLFDPAGMDATGGEVRVGKDAL
jgi:hypothetical protein